MSPVFLLFPCGPRDSTLCLILAEDGKLGLTTEDVYIYMKCIRISDHCQVTIRLVIIENDKLYDFLLDNFPLLKSQKPKLTTEV